MTSRAVAATAGTPMRSATSSWSVAAKPPTTSLCPPRYFVVECVTMSAPNLRGCCQTGVRNVLSTATVFSGTLALTPTAEALARGDLRVRGLLRHPVRLARFSKLLSVGD